MKLLFKFINIFKAQLKPETKIPKLITFKTAFEFRLHKRNSIRYRLVVGNIHLKAIQQVSPIRYTFCLFG